MSELRKLLYPIAIVYDAVTRVRNMCYDKGIFKTTNYDLPIIAVGNLSVGGTGKSPMIEYLIRLLSPDLKLATLSRGYRRKSSGFVLADSGVSSDDIGDEPMQFHTKFKAVSVAVDADRQHGIKQLQKLVNPDVILLDDAFQHRKVTAGFYVLLTKYNDLFIDDCVLPAGNLRESGKGVERADVVVVTKCPENISKRKQQEIREKLNVAKEVYFTSIGYAPKVNGVKNIAITDLKMFNFTLVTGIANPKPLVNFLSQKDLKFKHLAFKDHHNFTDSEIDELSKESLILTTEKDYMRLKDRLSNVCYLPIVTEFITEQSKFDAVILSFVK